MKCSIYYCYTHVKATNKVRVNINLCQGDIGDIMKCGGSGAIQIQLITMYVYVYTKLVWKLITWSSLNYIHMKVTYYFLH